MTRTGHDLLARWIFSDTEFVAPTDAQYEQIDLAPEWYTALTGDEAKKDVFGGSSIPPVSAKSISSMTPEEAKDRYIAPEKKALDGSCICESDDNCMLYYNWIERGSVFGPGYGFDLSDEQLAWLPQYVAEVEASCTATSHYPNVTLDEMLASDVKCLGEDEQDARTWEEAVTDFQASYAKRTEEGGRWIETHDGEGLAMDRDKEDYQARIRSHEMAKKRALRDEMLRLGLTPKDQAVWVAERIMLKRGDAVAKKAQMDAQAWAAHEERSQDDTTRDEAHWDSLVTMVQMRYDGEELDVTDIDIRAALASLCIKLAPNNETKGHILPSESNIRLSAYASCLASLGKDSVVRARKEAQGANAAVLTNA
ncbi:MAG: hypothetical protein H0U53_11075 [Actinobacteria bacterium]|nr:hypothetical protein [Actinomycetota bacterium]